MCGPGTTTDTDPQAVDGLKRTTHHAPGPGGGGAGRGGARPRDPLAQRRHQGAMPRDADFKQTLCADIDGNRAARRRALRCRRPAGAGATLPLHHAPRFGRRARANQRGRASGAQAQDPLARRHHAPGDVAAGVHAAAGCAGTQTEAAPDPFGVRVTSLREVSGPPLREPRRSRTQRQAARARSFGLRSTLNWPMPNSRTASVGVQVHCRAAFGRQKGV